MTSQQVIDLRTIINPRSRTKQTQLCWGNNLDNPRMSFDHPNNREYQAKRSKKIFGWLALVCGVGFFVVPVVGIAGTVMRLIDAFSELQKSGGADPEALAGDVSMALLAIFWGVVFSSPLLIASIVFLVLFLKHKNTVHSLMANQTGIA